MKDVFFAKLDRAARYVTPFLLTVFLLLISHIPINAPGMSRIIPLLALISVFHWGVYRPDLLPAYSVFLLGLLHDLLGGAGIGVWTLIYLLVYKVAELQRRFFFGRTFVWVWLGFSILTAFAIGIAWSINSLLAGQLIHLEAPAFQFFTTVGFYGPIAFVFFYCQKILLVWD